MKKIFTISYLLCSFLFCALCSLKAQQLSSIDFNFTGALSSNGWTAHSGVGTNPISTTAGLSYAGLTGSGVGNAALVGNAGGEDDNITFASQSTDGQSIYLSALVNITETSTAKAGDYFLHLGSGGGTTFTAFAARVFAKVTGTVVNFGISNSSTATYGTTAFAKNTTYLVIVKYTLNTAPGANDPVSLWIFPSGVPATEAVAGTPELILTNSAGQDAIAAIGLRQGSPVNQPETVVDAIKVGLTWSDVISGASTTPAVLTVTGTLNNFGAVVVGSFSASQTYTISGTNLTGAPGNITVTAPSTDFQVSNNNTTWGASTTIAYSSATLGSTTVYVRFSPQTAGAKTGNVSNSGGGAPAVTVPVNGTGTAAVTPVLSAGTLAGFGSVCLNSTAGPNSFIVTGTSLTNAAVTVGPLAAFTFATSAAGTYSNSLTLTQPGGSFSQEVFVKFTPTASQSYSGSIPVAGGGATTVNVNATGAGNNNSPSLGSSSTAAITTTTATVTANISSTGCTAISGYGLEYSLVSGFANGTGTTLSSTNLSGGSFTVGLSNLSAATTYYYKAFAINAGGTAYSAQQFFTTSTPLLGATPLTGFGSVCVNTVSSANSFTLSSTGISNANIVVGPLAGFSFSTTAAGTFTPSLTITQSGGAFNQIVFVKFSPSALQSYNGNIPVSGGGANPTSIAVNATGTNAAPSVTTGAAIITSPNFITAGGTITGNGCSNVSAYGIEYSGINNFTGGQGTKVFATNLIATNFTAPVVGLVQNTNYYFRAFAVNNGGTSYGNLVSVKTGEIPLGLIIYGTPVHRGSTMHYTLKDIKPSHYAAKIYNVAGQLVYRKDMILQVNFIDDNIKLPSNIGPGLYSLEIESLDYTTRKTFMIW